MERHLVMSAKERRRKVEFEGVRKGRLTIKQAAMRLELSYRHCRRAYKRFREEGDVGLVHRRRGRPSNRAKPQAFKEAVLLRYQERYEGFGPVLAMEKLAEEGYVVGRETLRTWLIEVKAVAAATQAGSTPKATRAQGPFRRAGADGRQPP